MISQSCVHADGTDDWDRALIAKYDVAGPRYTSYPTAPQFNDAFTGEHYQREVGEHGDASIAPLSLYIHIPFCQNICYYCACNKVITADHSVARRYLDYLAKEIRLQAKLFGRHRCITQLHIGGGTPTFLDGAELTELMHLLATHFNLNDSERREYSIEIDPRTVNPDSLALLKGLGFNRLSMGVQDFDAAVQKAVNRKQSFAMIEALTETTRLHQFKSLSFDLIYGLPLQSPQSITDTLQKVIALSPDRIAFYNYAHMPDRFKTQRAIDRLDLPSAAQKIAMLETVAKHLIAAGYQHIGMDHFVKASDDLAIASRDGKLQRNFQGYSTSMATELVGIGVSAISSMPSCYAQNESNLEAYYQRLDEGQLAIAKGLLLTDDDQLRRELIRQISCNLEVDIAAFSRDHQLVFSEYFSQELKALKAMENDGLLVLENDKIHITERGRVMLRNICMIFDKYLQHSNAIKFSNAL